ncbi:hypothetical protein FKM82_026524, partial [Ascaphus truei]
RKGSVAFRNRKAGVEPSSRRRQSSTRKKKSRVRPPSHSKEIENGAPSERVTDSSPVLITPLRKFVTLRRKAPARILCTKPPSGRRAKREVHFTPMSPDSACDFVSCAQSLRKRRKVCGNPSLIQNSSADTVHSPVNKAPLLSSTPSVLLGVRPSTNTSVIQLSFCEGLEESVVRSCTQRPGTEEEARPHTGSRQEPLPESAESRGRDTGRVTRSLRSVNNIHGRDDGDNDRVAGFLPLSPPLVLKEDTMGLRPLTGVKRYKIIVSQRAATSPPCYLLPSLSPVALSPSTSQSVICISEGSYSQSHQLSPQCHVQDKNSVFCTSSELFSDLKGETAQEVNEEVYRDQSSDET